MERIEFGTNQVTLYVENEDVTRYLKFEKDGDDTIKYISGIVENDEDKVIEKNMTENVDTVIIPFLNEIKLNEQFKESIISVGFRNKNNDREQLMVTTGVMLNKEDDFNRTVKILKHKLR